MTVSDPTKFKMRSRFFLFFIWFLLIQQYACDSDNQVIQVSNKIQSENNLLDNTQFAPESSDVNPAGDLSEQSQQNSDIKPEKQIEENKDQSNESTGPLQSNKIEDNKLSEEMQKPPEAQDLKQPHTESIHDDHKHKHQHDGNRVIKHGSHTHTEEVLLSNYIYID